MRLQYTVYNNDQSSCVAGIDCCSGEEESGDHSFVSYEMCCVSSNEQQLGSLECRASAGIPKNALQT